MCGAGRRSGRTGRGPAAHLYAHDGEAQVARRSQARRAARREAFGEVASARTDSAVDNSFSWAPRPGPARVFVLSHRFCFCCVIIVFEESASGYARCLYSRLGAGFMGS